LQRANQQRKLDDSGKRRSNRQLDLKLGTAETAASQTCTPHSTMTRLADHREQHAKLICMSPSDRCGSGKNPLPQYAFKMSMFNVSAIHINSRSWLRSSSTHEPSDPPLRMVRFGLYLRSLKVFRAARQTLSCVGVSGRRDCAEAAQLRCWRRQTNASTPRGNFRNLHA
jgi:hypothetical protein